MQAQDFQAAKWAIGQRLQNATNDFIEQAFNAGEIVRTHVLRPTWHFVSPQDIRWLLELTAPRVNIASGSAYRKFELDDRVFKQTTRILTRALKGGRFLQRSALKKILNESGVPADNGIRLGYILIRAELDAVICSGPRIGNQFTYALLEERVAETKPLNRDKALATLTQRYFASHGPATIHDFMWWSGLTAVDAKKGIEMLERSLIRMSHGDKVLWGPSSDETVNQGPTSASLLTNFDEYVVAYKDRSPTHDADEFTISNGLLGRTVIVDGQIVGSWKQTNDKGHAEIVVRPFRSLKKLERIAIEKAVDRYAKFLNIGANSILRIS
jgi:hypothetical protein